MSQEKNPAHMQLIHQLDTVNHVIEEVVSFQHGGLNNSLDTMIEVAKEYSRGRQVIQFLRKYSRLRNQDKSPYMVWKDWIARIIARKLSFESPTTHSTKALSCRGHNISSDLPVFTDTETTVVEERPTPTTVVCLAVVRSPLRACHWPRFKYTPLGSVLLHYLSRKEVEEAFEHDNKELNNITSFFELHIQSNVQYDKYDKDSLTTSPPLSLPLPPLR